MVSENKIVAGPLNSYMNLTWDCDGAVVQPDEICPGNTSFVTSSSSDFIQYLVTNDVTNFSFDIIIRTSEYND